MDSMKKYSKDFGTEDSSLDFKFFASFFFFCSVFLLVSTRFSKHKSCLLT